PNAFRGWSPVLASDNGHIPLHLTAGIQGGNRPLLTGLGANAGRSRGSLPVQCAKTHPEGRHTWRLDCSSIEPSNSVTPRWNAHFAVRAYQSCCSRTQVAAPAILMICRACWLPWASRRSQLICAASEAVAVLSTARPCTIWPVTSLASLRRSAVV